ncbi:hypothetical protein PAMA_015544 [Pampus argenteus]
MWLQNGLWQIEKWRSVKSSDVTTRWRANTRTTTVLQSTCRMIRIIRGRLQSPKGTATSERKRGAREEEEDREPSQSALSAAEGWTGERREDTDRGEKEGAGGSTEDRGRRLPRPLSSVTVQMGATLRQQHQRSSNAA